jgi:hypothetical protein
LKFKENDIVHSDLFGKGIVDYVSENENKVYRVRVVFSETTAYFNIDGQYFNGMTSLADIVLLPPIPEDTEIKYH